MKNKKEIMLTLLIVIDVVWILSIFIDYTNKGLNMAIFDAVVSIIFIIITIMFYNYDDYFAIKKIKKDTKKKIEKTKESK